MHAKGKAVHRCFILLAYTASMCASTLAISGTNKFSAISEPEVRNSYKSDASLAEKLTLLARLRTHSRVATQAVVEQQESRTLMDTISVTLESSSTRRGRAVGQKAADVLSGSIAPSAYDFGGVPVGSSRSITVTISNTGNGTLTFQAGYPMGDTAINRATIVNGTTCGASLNAGKSCTVTVSFVPQASGAYSGYVFVRFKEITDLLATSLTGVGTGGVTLSANASPSAYDFGGVPVGSSRSITVTISNTGNGTLTFQAGYPMGDTAINRATIVNGTTCGASLNAGESCTVTVSFVPQASGTYSGYVFVRFKEITDLLATTLSGQGTLSVIAPGSCSIVASPADAVAAGASVILTASCSEGSTPPTFAWSTGQTGGSIVVRPTTSTSYTAIASNSSGSASATVTVVVAGSPDILPSNCSIVASPSGPVVPGSLVTLTASCRSGSTPLAYQWSTGGETSSIDVRPSTSTTFTTIVSNGAGQAAASITVGVVSLSATPGLAMAVEYYNAQLDHYFVTAGADEINKLDTGYFVGWKRTGLQFSVISSESLTPTGASPVCRFYGNPAAGLDSHFYSASPTECEDVRRKFAGQWLLESSNVFQVYLPDSTTGACPDRTVPVFRSWNGRADSNHRYTTDPSIQASMIARGYVAEGYGSPPVAMCAPLTPPQ